MSNIYYWDIEVYPNYFLLVAKNQKSGDYTYIEIHDKDNGDLSDFIYSDIKLIGYNSIGYDAQITEFILRNPGCDTLRIKEFSDWLVKQDWPKWREYELKTRNLDMMLVNNYGHRSAKSTSLKKIEFFLRKKNIEDLPYHFDKELTDRQKSEVKRYCRYDVDVTEEFFEHTKEFVSVRTDLNNLLNDDFTNYPEPKLVKKFFTKKLAPLMNLTEKKFKELRTFRSKIIIKDIILPYINFNSKPFQNVLDFYKSLTLSSDNGSAIVLKKQIEKSIIFKGEQFDFGAGGLHQATKPGVYDSDSEYIIQDWDFSSYYPNLAILNKFYPQHLDEKFLEEYHKLYIERQTKYPKKTHYNINYLWKILLNSTYGLSNSQYGPFYDAQYTAQTCINGQLTLAMLVEKFAEIPGCKILQTNTDGTTIRIPRKYQNMSKEISAKFETYTKLKLELAEYRRMVIVDVNNYLAVDTQGNIKSKSLFETYETMLKEKSFHKDPSNNIIPLALERYFLKDIPIEKTINEHNNIMDFCSGVKGKSNFRWLTSTIQDGIVKNEFIDSRFIRYYIGGDTTLSKMWLRNGKSRLLESFTSVEATTPVTVCQTVRRLDINRKKRVKKNDKIEIHIDNAFPNLDRSWYIQKCQEIIDKIEA